MNVINILIDSLNRHMIGPYGGEVPTPNMDRLADRGVVFENYFIGSAPCMPARRELMSGRKEFFWRGWGPMEPFDTHIASAAKSAGAVTAMITDHYHYWENSAHGYFERFDCVRMIRGHELDMYSTDVLENVPAWVSNIDKWRPGLGSRYYNNVKDFKDENDFFSPKTLKEASDWLDANHSHEKFFLWVECFDAHEPFHVPEPYASMFTDEKPEDYNCWPPYQDGYCGHSDKWWEQATQKDVEFIRSQYKGKVAMIDAHLGKLLDKMDKYGLWDDTMVVLTTDHGHELGEKGRFGKQPPNYDQSAHIPLVICAPGIKAGRQKAIATAVDVYPTILEALGAKTQAPHGRSLMPLLRGETEKHRDAAVYGMFGAGATISDLCHTYHTGWDNSAPLFEYSANMAYISPGTESGLYIPGINCPVWKMPRRNQHGSMPYPELLFDRICDPGQNENILQENPGARAKMREILRREMEAEGVPEEQFRRLMLEE